MTRDLKTFKVDIQNSIRLRSLVPDDIIFVAESGIHSPDDIKALRIQSRWSFNRRSLDEE